MSPGISKTWVNIDQFCLFDSFYIFSLFPSLEVVRVREQVNRHGAIWAITQVHSANTICRARVLSRDSRDDKCDSLDLPSRAAAVTLIRALVGHLGIQPGSGDHRHCHHQHHRHRHHHLYPPHHHLHHTHSIFHHLLIIIITASFGFQLHCICAWQGYEAVSIIITTNFHLLEMLMLSGRRSSSTLAKSSSSFS